MIELSAQRIAAEAGTRIVAEGEDTYPESVSIDSRSIEPGQLFVGLPGATTDGGSHAAHAIEAGAWGVIVTPEHAEELADSNAWVLASPMPLLSLQGLARAWRAELGALTVGVTGSTGKTSTKELCKALMPWRTHASPANLNTEIGVPLAICSAPAGTQVLVLEMAARGKGQIAELGAMTEPDVGVIVNVGPVHLEQFGDVEGVAKTKAELLGALPPTGLAVLPHHAPHLDPYREVAPQVLSFGAGGDVRAMGARVEGGQTIAMVRTPDGTAKFSFPFTEAHQLENALCAIAIGTGIGAPLAEMASRSGEVRFAEGRGREIPTDDGVVIVDDSYNANPDSMRAAVDHLAAAEVAGRRIAVLGGMAELGDQSDAYHAELADQVRAREIDLLISVGELAQGYNADRHAETASEAVTVLREELQAGDRVLVKGSRSVGLEEVVEAFPAPDSAG
ncbi:MAG: UDP-N-acetylmuramoyl-tripeptide--D-alanyl-D-alanine ligase [Solirubrobacterales bacterium]